MLNTFDLFDLHSVLINIRNDPDYIHNQNIVNAILSTINSDTSSFHNLIRKAVSGVCDELPKEYAFVYKENEYPFVPFLLKNEEHIQILSYALSYLLNVIQNESCLRIQDTVDALHNLPLLLMQKNCWRVFWRANIVPYQKKWDKSFFKIYRHSFFAFIK